MRVSSNVIQLQPPRPQVDDIYLQMAASVMHAEGKFGPRPTDTLKPPAETGQPR